MNYGDLASIVQLGVGLHLGTAVLQIYGELGVAPFERRIARIRSLIRPEATATELEAELSQLEGRYELFKIEFFNQYRFYMVVNSIVALALAVLLIIIAIKAADVITEGWEWFAVLSIAMSLLPAPLTLVALWFEARRRLRTLMSDAERIESEALKASG